VAQPDLMEMNQPAKATEYRGPTMELAATPRISVFDTRSRTALVEAMGRVGPEHEEA
jgi:hypothetical protein